MSLLSSQQCAACDQSFKSTRDYNAHLRRIRGQTECLTPKHLRAKGLRQTKGIWHRSGVSVFPSRQAMKNKADVLFSRYIRARDGACRRCGSTYNLQCAHVVGRRYLAVRFDPDNALTLCAGCHKYYTHAPLEFLDFLEAEFGEGHFLAMKRRAQSGGKPDYEAIVAWLARELREPA